MSTPSTCKYLSDKPGVSTTPRVLLHAGLPALSIWLPVVRPEPATEGARAG